jgi:acetoacetate decarboxylase
MKNGSYFIPCEQIHPFFNPGSMNNGEGLYVCWETDPAIARRVLPPPLELIAPEHPIVMVYVVTSVSPRSHPATWKAASACSNVMARQ